MKRILSLVLALFLIVGCLCACSQENSGTTTPTSTPAPTQNSSNSSENTETPPPQQNNEPDLSKETVLPLTEDGTELELWWAYNSAMLNYSDMNDLEFIQELERRTGVHINYIVPSSEMIAEAFSISIVSGDYPDMWFTYSHAAYPGGGDKAIEDGVFLRLNEYIDNYAPNYRDIRENWGEWYGKLTITDEGNIYQFCEVYYEAEMPFSGLTVRQDWLDDLGMDIPVTIDDWHEMLVAFKEQKGATKALALPAAGTFTSSEFQSAYGALKDFYLDENGKIAYGCLTQSYLDYLTLIRGWIEEGLIDRDFAGNTASSMTTPNDYWANNETGSGPMFWGATADYKYVAGLHDDPNIWITAVNTPKLYEGQVTGGRLVNYPVRDGLVISAETEYPELCVRWNDYRYTEECAILSRYGIEGKSYTMVDGKPQFMDWMFEGQPNDAPKQHYYYNDDFPGLALQSFYDMNDAKYMVAYYTWEKDGAHQVVPTSYLTITADESSEISSILTDIETYVAEATLAFLTGQRPLDQFNAFVEQVESMNIARVIEVYQAAYDRFQSR